MAVFDGVAGVEPQSRSGARAAVRRARMCFVNKMDRMGANATRRDDRDQLAPFLPSCRCRSPPPLRPWLVEGVVDLVTNEAIIWSGEEMGAKFDRIPIADADIDESIKEKAAEYRAEMIELAVEQDEDALMAYLEGEARRRDAEEVHPHGHAVRCLRPGPDGHGLQEQGRPALVGCRRRLHAGP